MTTQHEALAAFVLLEKAYCFPKSRHAKKVRKFLESPPAFDLVAHLHRQRAVSLATFGPGTRADAVLDHLRKEMEDVEAAPYALTEWVDVVRLALEGAWRAGYTPEDIAAALDAEDPKS